MSETPRAAASQTPVLRLVDITRTYRQGTSTLEIFRKASMELSPGELVGLVGPSGAGKSSLLHIAGLLEAPDSGDVIVTGSNRSRLSETQRTRIRRDDVGFVYQFHHLLPEFNALENVAMPQIISGADREMAEEKASHLLASLGLGNRLSHRPAELSGGEQQRVAIARALANAPSLLLADEPTGNLDPRTAGQVYAELVALVRDRKLTALIATHNMDLAESMDRVIRLEGGRLIEQ